MTVALTPAQPVVVTQDEFNEWYNLQGQLATLKARESVLRAKIFQANFTDPREGTNKVPLSEGWILKATHVLNRTVDIAGFTAMRDELAAAAIPCDQIIKYKPELAISVYRTLTQEQMNLFDRVITIKPGTPQLEVVLPKRAQ